MEFHSAKSSVDRAVFPAVRSRSCVATHAPPPHMPQALRAQNASTLLAWELDVCAQVQGRWQVGQRSTLDSWGHFMHDRRYRLALLDERRLSDWRSGDRDTADIFLELLFLRLWFDRRLRMRISPVFGWRHCRPLQADRLLHPLASRDNILSHLSVMPLRAR